MLRFISKNAAILGVAAVACVAVVAGVNQLTAGEIAKQALAQKIASLQQVLPTGTDTSNLLASCRLVKNTEVFGAAQVPVYSTQVDGKTAYVVEAVAPDGYSGNIYLLVAVSADGAVFGVRTLAHKETPGLGDKIELAKNDWILSFTGKTVHTANEAQFAVRKDGGEFDQFAGATITPRAVVKAVKKAALYFQQQPQLLLDAPVCGGAK
jgi:electron transport complex protein RnfG